MTATIGKSALPNLHSANQTGPTITANEPLHVVLVDGNAPWIRSLFAAMPPEITVSAFRPQGLTTAVRHPIATLRQWRWRQTAPRWVERPVVVPSWSRAPRLTTALYRFHLGRRLNRILDDAVIVYNLPYYSGLAQYWADVPSVYFAYDPYACYNGWDPEVVAAGERELLAHCDAAFAISLTLADDFRKLTKRPVFVQQNGVSESFLAAFDGPMPPPDDLPPGGPPLVGVVGQLSKAYDWELLTDLVQKCPEISFVFVGPRFGEGPAEQARIERVFAASNVRWLGPRPHADLPRYIQRFDVCLNPLRVEPCNDRRSLLRLYDYLASDRPIVSTAIAPALEHEPHVEVGRDADELAALIRRRIGPDRPTIDRAARREYIRQHTWERRAQTFLANLRSVIDSRQATRIP
jgi:glycosyltransferase involved in cell wall biosynthesis